MTATATKQTAANNKALARVKRKMNAPIFKIVSETYNREGHDAARAKLATFFNRTDEARATVAAIFDAE